MNQARSIVRDNLRALMKIRPRLSSLQEVEAATERLGIDRKVSKSAIGRATGEAGESMKLDNLETLAEVFGVELWQLVHPNLGIDSYIIDRSGRFSPVVAEHLAMELNVVMKSLGD